MEEQFTHIIDKGLLDCFLSGFESNKNARAYLQEMDRVMRQSGCFIYITYADPSRRLQFLQQNNWTVKSYRLYRTCADEELIYFEQELFASDSQAPVTEFDKALAENMTKVQLEQYRHKRHHYAYVCQKSKAQNVQIDKSG